MSCLGEWRILVTGGDSGPGRPGSEGGERDRKSQGTVASVTDGLRGWGAQEDKCMVQVKN